MDPWLELPAALVAVMVLVGLLYRYVVLPQIQRDIVAPVRETHEQMTRNGHSAATRTIVDRLSDLEDQVNQGNEELAELRRDVFALGANLGHHMSDAQSEQRRIWSAIRARRQEPRDPHDP